VTAPTDCEPNWPDDWDDWDIEPPDPRLHDLRGQGLSLVQLHTITDIAISRQEYL
jgi:hypothetical protein